MTTLVIPAAGLSTRFNLDRPKFLLQHPMGHSMMAAGLAGLSDGPFDRVLVVSLESYFTKLDTARFLDQVQSVTKRPAELTLLSSPTSSMVATICRAIEEMDKDDSLIIKDCDNLVASDQLTHETSGDFLVYASVGQLTGVQVQSKSFVDVDHSGFVSNIVEKRVVSSTFNTGLVGFGRASDFLSAAQGIRESREIYVSDVVRSLMEDGHAFEALNACLYEDWGTLDDWLRYTQQFATVFIDVDGVIALNESPLSSEPGGWARFRPIESNCEILLENSRQGFWKLVFTTSRSESHRADLHRALEGVGFRDFELLMNLPHARRVLINDFAPTNPFPSAVAISLPRNATNLAAYLGEH